MNKYLISSFTECSLQFSNEETAREYADRNDLGVCKIYYLDEHTPKFIGYGIENENGLIRGNELPVKCNTWIQNEAI